jgi:regulatory protein YycI of two-component signal transduction system YycFG
MKKVRFNKDIKNYLIYFNNDCTYDNQWYNDDELTSFKKHASIEISELMKIHKSMTIKDAIKLLYQPGNICYDKNNFEEF